MHIYNFYHPSDHTLAACIQADDEDFAANIFRLCATQRRVVSLPEHLRSKAMAVLYFNAAALPHYHQAIMKQVDV